MHLFKDITYLVIISVVAYIITKIVFWIHGIIKNEKIIKLERTYGLPNELGDNDVEVNSLSEAIETSLVLYGDNAKEIAIDSFSSAKDDLVSAIKILRKNNIYPSKRSIKNTPYQVMDDLLHIIDKELCEDYPKEVIEATKNALRDIIDFRLISTED